MTTEKLRYAEATFRLAYTEAVREQLLAGYRSAYLAALGSVLLVVAGVGLSTLSRDAMQGVAAHLLLGKIWLRVGRFERAREEFARARFHLGFEFLLGAFEFHELLLCLHDLAVHVIRQRRANRTGGGRAQGRFLREKIGVNEFSRVVFASHAAILSLHSILSNRFGGVEPKPLLIANPLLKTGRIQSTITFAKMRITLKICA